MDLTALHEAVRAVAKGERPDGGALRRMSPAEREAFVALRRRVRSVGGKIERLVPPGDSAIWAAKAPAEQSY
ncbi:MAG: hypothetical protein HY690_11095 [Chloroflexi bacterium]|nr:hypothetical protein [Chloroflexota bacterium]